MPGLMCLKALGAGPKRYISPLYYARYFTIFASHKTDLKKLTLYNA
jgi:hypothetical protein